MRFLKAALPVALLATIAAADPATYYFGHGAKFVNIGFESEAEIETILGRANEATGEVTIDPAAKTGAVTIVVPVKALKTGIDMRDEHLRSDKWLDEARYPEITFKSKKVEFAKDKNEATVTGDFTLHGVSKEMTVTVAWTELSEEATKKGRFPEGKWAKFSVEFNVKCSDHGVKVADLSKVSDNIRIKASLFGCTSKPEKK